MTGRGALPSVAYVPAVSCDVAGLRHRHPTTAAWAGAGVENRSPICCPCGGEPQNGFVVRLRRSKRASCALGQVLRHPRMAVSGKPAGGDFTGVGYGAQQPKSEHSDDEDDPDSDGSSLTETSLPSSPPKPSLDSSESAPQQGGESPKVALIADSKDDNNDESESEARKQGPFSGLTRALRVSDLDRDIAKIALPALGTLSLEPLVALADMACVGYLGPAALGGVGVSNNVFNLSFTCFNFLGMATTPAIARAYGKGDTAEASRLTAQALWVAVFSGCAAMALLFRYTSPVVAFFGANELIAPGAVAYLRARIVAAPFFLSSMVANGAFRGFQDTRTPLLVGLGANLINITLYPSLIFGLGMGIRGAGIAFASGQIASGVSLFALLVRSGRLNLRDLRRVPRLLDVAPLLRTGAVLSVRTLSIFSTISYATATAARLGTVEVAAFEIGRQVFALFARLLDAISVAAQSLVALALGQGSHKKARITANRILQLVVMLGCSFVVILMMGLNTVPGVFTKDPAVRAMVAKTFPLMAMIQPINGLVFVFDGIYTAGRRFTQLSSAVFVSAAIASFTLFCVRRYALNLPLVWVGLNIMMVMRAALLGIGYFSKWSPVPRIRDDDNPLPPSTDGAVA